MRVLSFLKVKYGTTTNIGKIWPGKLKPYFKIARQKASLVAPRCKYVEQLFFKMVIEPVNKISNS